MTLCGCSTQILAPEDLDKYVEEVEKEKEAEAAEKKKKGALGTS